METVALPDDCAPPPPAKKPRIDGGGGGEEKEESSMSDCCRDEDADGGSCSNESHNRAITYPFVWPSDDEEEEFIQQYHNIKDEDIDKYNQQIKDTQGFDVDYFEGMDLVCKIIPFRQPWSALDEEAIIRTAHFVVDHLNKTKNANLTFSHVVKVNYKSCVCCYPKDYITFEARPGNGDTKTYQAIVYQITGRAPVLEFLREKP